MATLFGEIVYPSSRAFWTDDDNNEVQENVEILPSFTVEWCSDVPTKMKNLIVAETHLIIGFINEYVVENAVEICTIQFTKFENSNNHSKLYKITDDSFIIAINPNIDLIHAGEFVESINKIILKCENIIAITYSHISQLKTTDEISEPAFLRTLWTKKFADKQKILTSTLKQPNIISGVVAGVIAHAEIMGISAVLNILYLDGFELDSKSATLLIALFSNIVDYKVNDFTLKGKNYFNKGNLYMYTNLILYYSHSLIVYNIGRVD